MPLPLLQDATEVFGCSFLQAYGLTESTGGVTMLTPEDHRATDESTAHRLKSVGQPMFSAHPHRRSRDARRRPGRYPRRGRHRRRSRHEALLA
ncbi:hypothetical protein ACETU7_13470 [Rhodococcus sp. 3Y1]